jgi:hypothetical protein
VQKTLSRSSRIVAALIALFSMLFMQLAVASYACPALSAAAERTAMAAVDNADDQDMAGCEGRMDASQPGLCHAHSQATKQSLDKAELPHVQPFAAVGPALTLYSIAVADFPATVFPEPGSLTRTTAPPLSIRNCCFRI